MVVSVVGIFATGVGFLLKFFGWDKIGLFVFFKDNLHAIWIGAVTAIILLLFTWTFRLHRRFTSGFRDNFKGNLQVNWDFEGHWRIPEKGTLLVTGPSDTGGITKVGAQWENYTFTFKARIIRACLGVIVRAKDLDNYYMFQIRADKIRPHRRVAVPHIEIQPEQQSQSAPQIKPIVFEKGWQIFKPSTPLTHTLDDWFDVRITVRGESVIIYIDNNIVLQSESFLKIPNGKVGFRNSGSEEALVRNVKVMLQS